MLLLIGDNYIVVLVTKKYILEQTTHHYVCCNQSIPPSKMYIQIESICLDILKQIPTSRNLAVRDTKMRPTIDHQIIFFNSLVDFY